KYTGFFKDNLFEGEGTYTWADGTSQKGVYSKGELVE
ncbi:MAG: molecular chaperone Tir, partial [Bacteroidales bacterium]|nr:molecular chaperone Tir [Bacteroidales bacterium]